MTTKIPLVIEDVNVEDMDVFLDRSLSRFNAVISFVDDHSDSCVWCSSERRGFPFFNGRPGVFSSIMKADVNNARFQAWLELDLDSM